MSFFLIRHGCTQGNVEKRYIGCRTDEPLCDPGRAELAKLHLPAPAHVFVSPMKRCTETAALLFPGIRPLVVKDLRECDFGRFEGKNHLELASDADYQRWVDSMGTLPFPQGESREAFVQRSLNAFAPLWEQYRFEPCALVAHGGTIMAIMEAFARPKGSYYDFQCANAHGYMLHPDGSYGPLGY